MRKLRVREARSRKRLSRALTPKRFHNSIDKRSLHFNIALPNGRVRFINNQSKKSPAFGSVVVSPRYMASINIRLIDIDSKLV